jgi:hypothetical protein
MIEKDDHRGNFLRDAERAVKYLRGAKPEGEDASEIMATIGLTLKFILRELKETGDDDETAMQRSILWHVSEVFIRGQIEITNRPRRQDISIVLHVAAMERQSGDFASVVKSTAEYFDVSESTVTRALRKHRDVLSAWQTLHAVSCQK